MLLFSVAVDPSFERFMGILTVYKLCEVWPDNWLETRCCSLTPAYYCTAIGLEKRWTLRSGRRATRQCDAGINRSSNKRQYQKLLRMLKHVLAWHGNLRCVAVRCSNGNRDEKGQDSWMMCSTLGKANSLLQQFGRRLWAGEVLAVVLAQSAICRTDLLDKVCIGSRISRIGDHRFCKKYHACARVRRSVHAFEGTTRF